MATELAIAERNPSLLQRQAPESHALDPFEPQTWPEMLKFADVVARTDFAPKDFKGKPEACAIAMLYGRQLGIGGLQAIQNIAVINGRPSVWGDLFWAIVLSHPEFVDVQEKNDENGAYVKLTRRNRTPKEATFTKKDAETAGLWKKQGPWTNYPANQMLWRARTIAGRALFADALKGMTSTQEASDFDGPTIDGTLPNSQVGKAVAETVTAENPPAKIKQEEARDFGKAWKASGFTIDEAKANLQSICGVQSSLDITTDKYNAAMAWATKNPAWPDPAPVMGPDEKLCREMFGILCYDLAKQAQVIEDAKSDWTALAQKLNAELPAE